MASTWYSLARYKATNASVALVILTPAILPCGWCVRVLIGRGNTRLFSKINDTPNYSTG